MANWFNESVPKIVLCPGGACPSLWEPLLYTVHSRTFNLNIRGHKVHPHNDISTQTVVFQSDAHGKVFSPQKCKYWSQCLTVVFNSLKTPQYFSITAGQGQLKKTLTELVLSSLFILMMDEWEEKHFLGHRQNKWFSVCVHGVTWSNSAVHFCGFLIFLETMEPLVL